MARTFRLTLPRLGNRWRSARRWQRGVVFSAGLLAMACGSRLPAPPTGPHPAGSTTYLDIPFPPPPARVEIIPAPPREEGAVWVDGEWAWQGKRWGWLPGGWMVPPRGAYFAPWLVYRLDNGRLLFAAGTWHASNGERLPNPVVLEAARNGLDDESSALVDTPAASAKPP
jgi:hypothetical protein